MQKIIDFIIKYKNYLVFIALSLFSLSLISGGDVSRLGGFRSYMIGTVGWVEELFAWIPNPSILRKENEALRNLNLKLSSEVTRMRRALIENKKLRQMIGITVEDSLDYVSAEIVGKTAIQMRTFGALNKGASSGVREGMAVRTDAGLVGSIKAVSENYSLMELIQNYNVRISAKILRTNLNGIIVWDGDKYFLMKNIPESFDVKVGDEVYTSNMSSKFPADVPIGVVRYVGKDIETLFYKIHVEPYANFTTLEQVFIVKYLPNPQKLLLIEKMRERLELFNATN